MPRILYVCPDTDTPVGGVKVIYRHVALLRENAYDAYVMHMDPAFARCTWFDSSAPVLHLRDLRPDDVAVVPENMIELTYDLRKFGTRYGVFAQNGYLVLPHVNFNAARETFLHAEAILSISDDSASLLAAMFPESAGKIVRVQYSVDAALFCPQKKDRIVTYMPRKQPVHVHNVVPWLASQCPDWDFVPLDGLSESEIARHLGASRIFLAFSDFEGCPLPPIEAALAGNLVVGYSGYGGDEYWSEPNFLRVGMGDLRDFVRKFRDAAALADDPAIDARLAPGRQALAARYSRANELRLLRVAMARVAGPGA